MNVIILFKNNVIQKIELVKHDVTAQATFDRLVKELVGDDIDEVDLHGDNQIDDLNRLIKHEGFRVEWYEGLTVNNYKNV